MNSVTLKPRPASSTSAPLSVSNTFVYTNPRGLHARPAALLVKTLSPYKSLVIAQCNGEKANAKSILGMLCLAVGAKSRVTFTATGPDAYQAIAAVEKLFVQGFNEAY